jgi:hypothetical protein
MNKLKMTIAVLSVCSALAICAERSEKSKALNGTSGKTLRHVLTSERRTPGYVAGPSPSTKYDAMTSTPDRFRWKFSVISRSRLEELSELFALACIAVYLYALLVDLWIDVR